MLRLEKMQLRGFKSFSESTEVRFQDGITAVVGPNGCGKSNIGDALNWVLGEQSAKNLRGSQMADVIFAGTALRKPLGMAEVSLKFGGAEGLPQADNGQIVLTRRLFRTGESEYLLNGTRARLRDIQEMLREARVGARSYATIEQGKIDQVLNAKPKDRRVLIEDAAGVSGYRHKRRLAELKLEATHANLLRVNDIVVEVQRQINSLKRQAAKARRYRKLRDELREKELVRFTRQAKKMDAELVQHREAEAGARDVEAEALAGLSRLEAELLEKRESLEQAGRALRETSDRLHRLELEIDRNESQVRGCRERIDESTERSKRLREESVGLEARQVETDGRRRANEALCREGSTGLESMNTELSRIQGVLEAVEQGQRRIRDEIERLRREQFESMSRAADLRNGLRSSDEALERNAARTDRLEKEQSTARHAHEQNRTEADQLNGESETLSVDVERLRQESARLESELREARVRHGADVEQLAEAREQEKSSQAKLSTLEALETRFAGVSDGVRMLLTSASAKGIRAHGVVADYVEASREVEGAAEAYLQALLPAVILEDDLDARRAADLLRAEGAGRISLICRSQPTGALAVGNSSNGGSEIPGEVLQDPRVLGRLRDRLKLKASSNGVVADRIGDAVLVDSLESALELHRRHPAADYLTPDGEVVYASGVISAGARNEGDEGLLAHRRRVEEVRCESLEASARAASTSVVVESGRTEIVRLESEFAEKKQALEVADRRAVELRLRVEHSAGETERNERHSAVLADELRDLQEEARVLRTQRAELADEAQLVEASHAALERGLEERSALLDGQEQEMKSQAEAVTTAREQHAVARQCQQAADEEGRRLCEEAAELESRLQALATEAADADASAARAAELLAQTERELLGQLESQKGLAADTQRMEREIAERRERLTDEELGLRSRRHELEQHRERTRDAELERTRAESAREHLDDLCRQELGVSVTEALTLAAENDEATDEEPVDLEALAETIEEIKQRIERIGPVNMTAIEEFTELDERHGFLTAQKQDLEHSMASLKETIRRVNRQSRERFLEAFESIRKSYQEIYRLLFSGGRADLRLEEGEDVLECGIEILAQPPGKRLAGVHLLSGGEKALSAIALLFAIFRFQPSPFCLLDEVDAPLDDSNVVRFTRMLGEYAKNTQFVMITHNKVSMEAAGVLYGVTMEEPGISKLVSMQLH